MEFKVDINGEERTINVKSIKSREAQKYLSMIKQFDKIEQGTKDALELSEKVENKNNELLKEYAGLKDSEIEELTVDDRTKITDYFRDQAFKYVVGFSTASQKQEN